MPQDACKETTSGDALVAAEFLVIKAQRVQWQMQHVLWVLWKNGTSAKCSRFTGGPVSAARVEGGKTQKYLHPRPKSALASKAL